MAFSLSNTLYDFKAYTLGSHCTVFTDHNPLAHLKTANLGAIEHRWVAQLAPFDIEVRYRSGKSNQCADALSRCPANMSSEETVSVLHLAMDSTLIRTRLLGFGTGQYLRHMLSCAPSSV